MKRTLKWVGIGVAVLLVLLISLPFLVNVNQFKPALEASLTQALGREVKLGDLHLSLFAGEVTANDLWVADDPHFGKPAFVQARSLKVGVEVVPFLLSRRLHVKEITLDRPEIVLVQAPSGDWNFSSLGGKSAKSTAAPPPANAPAKASLDLSVERLRITGGQLTLGRTLGHWKPLVLKEVNLDLSNFSASTSFPFSLSAQVAGGGALALTGKAGPINGDDAAMTPVNVAVHMTGLNLAASGMNDSAPDVDGLVSMEATGDSDGRLMRLNGTLKAEKLKLARKGRPAARLVELDFAVEHDLRRHSGTIRKGDVHIGAARAAITGTYAEEQESMVVHLKLAGPRMPLTELAAMLPALAVELPAGATLQSGTASAELAMDGATDKLVSGGTLAVNGARLAGFDLPKRFSSIEKLAGIKSSPDAEIQELSANVRVAPEGTAANDIRLVVPAIGTLRGGGTVSPDSALDFKMTAAVEAGGLTAALNNQPIPFTVQGTCADPVFRPDVKAVVKDEVKGLAGGLIKGFLGRKKN